MLTSLYDHDGLSTSSTWINSALPLYDWESFKICCSCHVQCFLLRKSAFVIYVHTWYNKQWQNHHRNIVLTCCALSCSCPEVHIWCPLWSRQSQRQSLLVPAWQSRQLWYTPLHAESAIKHNIVRVICTAALLPNMLTSKIAKDSAVRPGKMHLEEILHVAGLLSWLQA